MKPQKQPDDHIWCPLCGKPYGFIRCRVTLRNPTRNRCLSCGQKDREGTLGPVGS